MKPADLETVQRMFECVAPTAAAEMRSRAISALKKERSHFAPGSMGYVILGNAMKVVENVPLSKEATT
jgi:hypothetical protein